MDRATARVLTTREERCKFLWAICTNYSLDNFSAGVWRVSEITLPDGTNINLDDEDSVLDAFCKFTDSEGK